jgi:hypothetical protein
MADQTQGKTCNVRDLLGGAPAPTVPGKPISTLLAEEVSRQSPPLRAGIADIVRRKQGSESGS